MSRPEPTACGQELSRPRCRARFRGKAGLRGWCPGCGRRLVELQLLSTWPDWFELPDFGTRYYRCPGLMPAAKDAALPRPRPLRRKAP